MYPWIVQQLLVVVSIVKAFHITPCTYPIQPKVEKIRLMAIFQETYQPSHLLEQFHQNPCLELEHYADAQNKSTIYTFYGTCGLRRMFRYTARSVPLYNCWIAELAVWNPAQSLRCESSRSEDSVTIYDELVDTRTNSSDTYRKADIGLRKQFDLWISAPVANGKRASFENVGNVCNCQRIKEQSLVQHWKAQCSKRSADRRMSIVWAAAIVLVITAVWFTVNH